MYQYDKHLDFHALGREIKRKREEKGWTQEYLAQLVNRTPRSIMYIENRGQYPSFDTFYQLVTLLEISVDQFFFPDKLNGESTCRKQIDVIKVSLVGELNTAKGGTDQYASGTPARKQQTNLRPCGREKRVSLLGSKPYR